MGTRHCGRLPPGAHRPHAPLKYLLPEALPLLERYRSLELADVSAEQCLILKGRGRLLVDAIAAELC